MGKFIKAATILAVAGGLSACVNSDLERAGVGAAAGLGTALNLDTNPVVGDGAGVSPGAP